MSGWIVWLWFVIGLIVGTFFGFFLHGAIDGHQACQTVQNATCTIGVGQ